MFGAIHRARLKVLASIAADPTTLVPVFELAGGSAALFAGVVDEELLAIYVALEHTRDQARDQLFAAQCARFLLRHMGCWSDEDHWGFGSMWTVNRLGRLFESHYPCPPIVTMHALRLIDLDRRLSRAQSHLEQARRLLTPTIENWQHHAERLLSGQHGKAVA